MWDMFFLSIFCKWLGLFLHLIFDEIYQLSHWYLDFILESVLITNLIFLLVINLLRFSICFWVSFGTWILESVSILLMI